MVCVMSVRTWIEPVVAGAQLASAFYDTGLLLIVKNYYNQTNSSSGENSQQKAISNFFIIYKLLDGLTPLVSAYGLAKLGDMKSRKISICVPLLGYLLSRILLLLLILLTWPIEVMYGAAVLHGLAGGFCTYWASVMALTSHSSSASRRSLRLIIVELVYGIAGFVGSIVSGHLFVSFHLSYRHGTVLVSCSIALYAFCLLYSLFVLRVPKPGGSCPAASMAPDHPDSKLADNEGGSICGERQPAMVPSKLMFSMLFVAAIMYDLSVAGAMDVLPLFLLKKPLSWGAVYIGYANAAGFLIFITSFLGVFVFSRFLRDTTMIIIGIVSFSAGIFIMAFVRWTYLFYVARAAMLFALIPLPTIRSLLSKHIEGTSYGKVFVLLQLSLVITGVVTSTAYNKIYQNTLDWFGGYCFLLSCGISCLSLIPISIVAWKQQATSGSLEILTN
ncbi:solute carrier family 46 member 2 isoform X2 [Rhineura floridana]|uniref:solute carrier family 46 member 2 isoform X2 n=1 Tax=Rhineura floridana TaxID=261503 RepID=UPI002AC849F4|nr:solute carrier family 46 member 2 isoform X2 [Rhineura floridana]XP_061488492.1 solute carrier family 46 member 2 isoform X2 [Rhineura floridana]XP_061488502.1 solute carrier family 46 member 2 isoform X2 [Rhineura floridana]